MLFCWRCDCCCVLKDAGHGLLASLVAPGPEGAAAVALATGTAEAATDVAVPVGDGSRDGSEAAGAEDTTDVAAATGGKGVCSAPDRSVCTAVDSWPETLLLPDAVETDTSNATGTGNGDVIGQVRSVWHMASRTRSDRAGETALA